MNLRSEASREFRVEDRAPAKRRSEARGKQGAAGRREATRAPVPGRRRPAWRSPLTRRILLVNLLVLVIPVLGLLHLDQYRQSLIQSELRAMTTQATTVALALGSTAIRDADTGEQELMHETVRQLLRVLLSSTTIRARVFARDGELVGDSYLLSGPDGQVMVEELAPPNEAAPAARWLGRLYDAAFAEILGARSLPLYREIERPRADDYAEAAAALEGERASRLRIDSNRRLVLSVAVPVQRYRQVLAALMVTKDGSVIENAVRDRRRDILIVFAVAMVATVLLSLYLSRTIARPIRRLAEAADRVRGARGQGERIPDLSGRRDEIGDLSAALVEMTEALGARMAAIEAFAADVAHEIKNPLTSLRSAVETAARVEDPEQQKKLMSIIVDDVQRLDRLISDISGASRLDAELARGRSEEVDVARLLETFVEVHRTSLGEAGPGFRLEIPPGERLTVLGIEDRLGQVLRNLIANAVSFSPPGGTIDLAAWRESRRGEPRDRVVVTVSDRGPGMPEGKLEAIFDRFYSERPKGEKFGTHSGLGLSISKQIVEAHGGTIVAENRRGGGARFTLRLPAQ